MYSLTGLLLWPRCWSWHTQLTKTLLLAERFAESKPMEYLQMQTPQRSPVGRWAGNRRMEKIAPLVI